MGMPLPMKVSVKIRSRKKTPAYLMKRFFDFFVGWPWEKTPVRLCLQVGPPCFLGGIV